MGPTADIYLFSILDRKWRDVKGDPAFLDASVGLFNSDGLTSSNASNSSEFGEEEYMMKTRIVADNFATIKPMAKHCATRMKIHSKHLKIRLDRTGKNAMDKKD